MTCLLCVVLGRYEDLDSASRSLATLLYSSSLPAIRPRIRHASGREEVQMQFSPFKSFPKKVEKVTTQWDTQNMLRKAWKKADAYRPGTPNEFTTQPKDLASLHRKLRPSIEKLDKKGGTSIPGAGNGTSLLGAFLKQLATGDQSLFLASPEAPVLKELRESLVKRFKIKDAIRGLPEEQGRVLSVVALGLDARKMIDLGTFTGYSSLAMALPTATDARVICSEKDSNWADKAEAWWKKANCSDKMEMHVIDADKLLQNMIENDESGTVDMIFCDIDEREKYGSIHEKAVDLLRVGGMVIYYDTLWAADKLLDHEYFPAMRAFNDRLSKDPRIICTLVPLSYGLTLCTKTMDLRSSALQEARSADESNGDRELLRKMLLERREIASAEREEVLRALQK